MQIAYHLGAHGTDDERLVRGLMRNRATLAEHGTDVPAPRLYRALLPKIARSLRGAPAGEDAQQVFLDSILEEHTPARLVLSGEQLLCFPMQAIMPEGFYTLMPNRVLAYSNLFPMEDTQFFMALKNPATLIPALIAKANGGTYEAVMSGHDPRQLRWSDVIRATLDVAPGLRLTLWCDEDTPFVWPEVVRAVAGLGPEDALDTDYDVLGEILNEDGLAKLKAYFDAKPPTTIEERRRMISAFLDKFADPAALEVELPLPGWTDDLVAEITDAYLRDCAAIARFPGVTFITP